MPHPYSFLNSVKKHLKQVVISNAVTLVNGIFFAVTVLLVIFKEFHEALFLAVILFFNIIIGIVQDLRAKIALEELQILMAPKIIRISNTGEEVVGLEDIQKGNLLKVTIGDQIPADGTITESSGLEVNEALLTGESNDIRKIIGGIALAGSIVTAGGGIVRVEKIPKDSFVSHMTDTIKKYSVNLSPIQQTLKTFITYMTYLLLAIVVYVVIHGVKAHELVVGIVKDIAALTSTLVPQGLILATTVFFAYGAVCMFRKKVLLQEINATEKLGRIKNLCVDKTGTLTENHPTLEDTLVYDHIDSHMVRDLAVAYITANGDTSETMQAINRSLKHDFRGPVLHNLPFSSARKYGLATVGRPEGAITVAVGAPDILLSKITVQEEHSWVSQHIATHAVQAKRLVLLASAQALHENEIGPETTLHPLALFVLANPLRPGTVDIINFFQNRKVSIRVISGDNVQTVQAIARQAGIKHTDISVTGPELEAWDEEQWQERVPAYHVFARVKPEQKEKIISILKTHGYTAMVGDGANDALAIKKADLGIAMFDGSAATRQIAQVVLMNNSFAALPVGVMMAETIITNIELVAGIFFNKVTIGLLLFVVLAIFGYTYPLSPRNTTIINYFAIWLPMFYWAIFPAKEQSRHIDGSFLRRVLPVAILNGIISAGVTVLIFLLGPNALKFAGSNILVVLALIIFGFWFFVLVPKTFGIFANRTQQKILYGLAALSLAFVSYSMLTPSFSKFFDLHRPPLLPLLMTCSIIFLGCFIQYQITKTWFFKKPALIEP